MEIFPETILISNPLRVDEEWKTTITDFQSGKEHRQKRWAFPKHSVGLTHKVLKQSEMATLWEFCHKRCGSYDTFWFLLPLADNWYGEYVGTGDGSTHIFDLPSKSTTGTIYVSVNGVLVGFAFISGGGQAGSDRVNITVAPSQGAIITATFYGRLRLKARFAVDKLTKEMFEYLLFNAQIDLIEVK